MSRGAPAIRAIFEMASLLMEAIFPDFVARWSNENCASLIFSGSVMRVPCALMISIIFLWAFPEVKSSRAIFCPFFVTLAISSIFPANLMDFLLRSLGAFSWLVST